MEVEVEKNKSNNCEVDLNPVKNNDDEDKKEDFQQENNPKAKTSKQKVGLEDFEIIGSLGNGSFGEVTLVKKKESDQMYAMKAINKNFLFKVKCLILFFLIINNILMF